MPLVPILALDLGLHLGWAIRYTDGSERSGQEHIKPAPWLKGRPASYLCFREWLRERVATLGDDELALVIAYEAPFTGSRAGMAAGYGREFACLVDTLAAERRIQTLRIYPSSLKKHATGRGNASKADMIIAARRRWRREPKSSDEADALCVLSWAIETLEPVEESTG